MICSKCGTVNPDGSSFCQNCGSRLAEGSTNNAAPDYGEINGGAKDAGFTQNQNFGGGQNPGGMQYIGGGNQIPNGGGMIPHRDIALCIVFTIITCGIYGFYWLYQLTENVNTLDNDPDATSGGLVILFSLITCGIYEWYWLYKQGDRIDKIKGSRGLQTGSLNILYMILGIFGLAIISYALMQNEINQLAAN